MPFLTTITVPNYVAPPQEIIAQISNWCANEASMGNYTGEASFQMLPDGTTHECKRWAWANYGIAEAYIDYTQSLVNPPGMITDISEI